jgi:hypothetical protein
VRTPKRPEPKNRKGIPEYWLPEDYRVGRRRRAYHHCSVANQRSTLQTTTTRTHFTFAVDTWTPDGESIVEHVAA